MKIPLKKKLEPLETPFGVYVIDDDDYRTAPGVSNSDLNVFLKSPKHYEAQILKRNRREDKEEFAFGRAFHCYILEPNLFEHQFVVVDEVPRRGTKKHDEFMLHLKGREYVRDTDLVQIKAMKQSLLDYKDEEGKNFFIDCIAQGDALAEVALFFTHHKTKTLLRSKTDLFVPRMKAILDIKTTSDASMRGFANSAAKYNYHRQAAFYLMAASQVTGVLWSDFYFVAIEKQAPYIVSMYKASTDFVAQGAKEIEEALERLESAKIKNDFPGYQKNMEILELPKWRKDVLFDLDELE